MRWALASNRSVQMPRHRDHGCSSGGAQHARAASVARMMAAEALCTQGDCTLVHRMQWQCGGCCCSWMARTCTISCLQVAKPHDFAQQPATATVLRSCCSWMARTRTGSRLKWRNLMIVLGSLRQRLCCDVVGCRGTVQLATVCTGTAQCDGRWPATGQCKCLAIAIMDAVDASWCSACSRCDWGADDGS